MAMEAQHEREYASFTSDLKDSQWWNLSWGQIPRPRKVKIFIWRAFHETLPSDFNPSRRSLLVSPICSKCLEKKGKTVLHVLGLL